MRGSHSSRPPEKCYEDESDVSASGFDSEDAAGVGMDRGDGGDYVNPDGSRVLTCVGSEGGREPQEFFQATSDALKRLFRENRWGLIRAMNGFDTGDLSKRAGPANLVYTDWL